MYGILTFIAFIHHGIQREQAIQIPEDGYNGTWKFVVSCQCFEKSADKYGLRLG